MRYLCILALFAFAATGVSADLLWDNGLPDGRNGISVGLWPGTFDREVVDDVNVEDPGWYVYDGHFRLVTYSGYGPDIIDAVNMYFYEDIGNEPSVDRYAERAASFSAYLTGDYYFDRPEIAVDVKFDTVELGAGKWWVCFAPTMDDNPFWLTTASPVFEPIWVSMPDYGYPKWTRGFDAFGEDYDMSFQLTGEIIPEPGVVSLAGLLLGAGALWLRRK